MLKTKYYYNPVTCSYERVRTSMSFFVVRSLFFLFFSAGLAALMCMYCQNHFISPKEEELSLHNHQLEHHYVLLQKKIEDSLNHLKLLQQQDNHFRMLLDVAPLSAAEHNAGMGGANKYAHLGKDTLIAQTLSKVDQLASQLSIQQKSYDRLLSLAQKKRSRLQSMPSLPPVAKEHLKRISGFFGMRPHPIFGIRKMHYGVDFAAPIHTPIYAAADGRVKWKKDDKKGYGKHMLIEHGNGFQTHYAHMHAITVKERQLVVRGQQIGTVGKSGDATGPHLHYEVYYNRKRVDPLDYFVGELTAAEYAAVRKLSTHQTKALCSNF